MVFIVRAKFQPPQDLRHHTTVMTLIRIPDHRAEGSPVDWPRGLRFPDQITQGLLADNRENDITHDSIRFLQRRASDLEQQILLARDALQVLEQFTLDPMLGARADVVNGFDKK